MDLSTIVKAYDVRGTVPDQLDEPIARAIGAAFVDVTGATKIVTAHDMRDSGPGLARAFAEGALHRGASVVEAGLGSTDMLYFASGHLDLPGAMFTASHNPAQYNGIKMCRANAVAIGQDTGLAEIGARAARAAGRRPAAGRGRRHRRAGRPVARRTPQYLRSLVDLSGIRPLQGRRRRRQRHGRLHRARGARRRSLPALPLTIVPLYFELDGTFPNHEANPLEPANLVDLQRAVVAEGADIGLAFDGDADRCFVVDAARQRRVAERRHRARRRRELAKAPGVGGDPQPDHLPRGAGGDPRGTAASRCAPASGTRSSRPRWSSTNAVFGGEHSAHYYFRDFWFADTGMLAAMHVLAALGEQPGDLADLTAKYTRYAASGEINSTVDDQHGSPRRDPVAAFADRAAAIDELDGLTVELPDGSWFNVRASNTEPLLRLNVEGPDDAAMAAVRDEVLASSAAEQRQQRQQ